MSVGWPATATVRPPRNGPRHRAERESRSEGSIVMYEGRFSDPDRVEGLHDARQVQQEVEAIGIAHLARGDAVGPCLQLDEVLADGDGGDVLTVEREREALFGRRPRRGGEAVAKELQHAGRDRLG